jgi:hypothetical protein
MTPSTPHSITMGTTERNMSARETRTCAGQLSIGPMLVVCQGNSTTKRPSCPPPFKKDSVPGRAVMRLNVESLSLSADG